MNKDILAKCGEVLFGEQWVTPLANELGINRKTIQRYNNGELKINDRLAGDIAKLLANREYSINKLRLILDEDFAVRDARLKAINAFIKGDASKLTPTSKIYCKIAYGKTGYHKAYITLNKPENLEGWQSHQLDEKYFIRDLVNLKDILSEKMQNSQTVYDKSLDDFEYTLDRNIFDFDY